MSRVTNAIDNDLKLLRLARDELGLKVHLMKADAKTSWQELEHEWSLLQTRLDRASAAGAQAVKESEAAVGLLIESLRTGYARIGSALKP